MGLQRSGRGRLSVTTTRSTGDESILAMELAVKSPWLAHTNIRLAPASFMRLDKSDRVPPKVMGRVWVRVRVQGKGRGRSRGRSRRRRRRRGRG